MLSIELTSINKAYSKMVHRLGDIGHLTNSAILHNSDVSVVM